MKEKITRTSVCDDEEGVFIDNVAASKYNRYNTLNTAAEVLELFFSKNAGLPLPPQSKKITGHHTIVCAADIRTVTTIDRMIRAPYFSGYVREDFFSILFSFFFLFCLLALKQNTCTNWIGTRRVFTLSGIVPSKSQQSDRWLTPTVDRSSNCVCVRFTALPSTSRGGCSHTIKRSMSQDSLRPYVVLQRQFLYTMVSGLPMYQVINSKLCVEYKKSQSSRLQKRVFLFFYFYILDNGIRILSAVFSSFNSTKLFQNFTTVNY